MQTKTKVSVGILSAVIVSGVIMMAMASGLMDGDNAKTALIGRRPPQPKITMTPTPLPTPTPQSFVRVTAPNGGETFTAGQTVSITWQTTNSGLNNCRIAWGKGSSFFADQDITPYPAGTNNSGSYSWTIPTNITTPTQGKITVYCQGGGIILGTPQSLDVSDAAFTINPASASTPSPTPVPTATATPAPSLNITRTMFYSDVQKIQVYGTYAGTPQRIEVQVRNSSGALHASGQVIAPPGPQGAPGQWNVLMNGLATYDTYTITAKSFSADNTLLSTVTQPYTYR